MQRDLVPGDCRIDCWLDSPPIAFRRPTGNLGGQTVGLVDDEANHLRHAFVGRAGVGRQRGKGEEILQEGTLERQRGLAPDLQVEDVELVACGELHRRIDRLVPPLRTKCFLDQPDEAFRRRPDIRLSDQGQLGALRAEHG